MTSDEIDVSLVNIFDTLIEMKQFDYLCTENYFNQTWKKM